jgi:hypothetical protein
MGAAPPRPWLDAIGAAIAVPSVRRLRGPSGERVLELPPEQADGHDPCEVEPRQQQVVRHDCQTSSG